MQRGQSESWARNWINATRPERHGGRHGGRWGGSEQTIPGGDVAERWTGTIMLILLATMVALMERSVVWGAREMENGGADIGGHNVGLYPVAVAGSNWEQVRRSGSTYVLYRPGEPRPQ